MPIVLLERATFVSKLAVLSVLVRVSCLIGGVLVGRMFRASLVTLTICLGLQASLLSRLTQLLSFQSSLLGLLLCRAKCRVRGLYMAK